jgi:hypothetical protein
MRPLTEVGQHILFLIRYMRSVKLSCGLIALSATASFAQPCTVPHYQIVTKLVRADGVFLLISLNLNDFAPHRLVCLSGALKKLYGATTTHALMFSSDEAARYYLPGRMELSPTQQRYQEQLHASYVYYKWAGGEYVSLHPGGKGWDYDPRWDTRIDLPVSSNPICTLAMSNRCLLAFEPVSYPFRDDKKNGGGQVAISGVIGTDGSLTDLGVADAQASQPDQRTAFADYALNNMKTWHFEPAARRDPIRITYRFMPGKSWFVSFHLPEVTMLCAKCNN